MYTGRLCDDGNPATVADGTNAISSNSLKSIPACSVWIVWCLVRVECNKRVHASHSHSWDWVNIYKKGGGVRNYLSHMLVVRFWRQHNNLLTWVSLFGLGYYWLALAFQQANSPYVSNMFPGGSPDLYRPHQTITAGHAVHHHA